MITEARMPYFSSDDVDMWARDLPQHAPELERFCRFLSEWRDTVDANGDGWTYWKSGRRPADKLCELLDTSRTALREGRPDRIPGQAQFLAALRPIKGAATRLGLQAPELAPEFVPAGPGMR